MGLESILTAIRASGEEQVRQIETGAQAQVEAILAEARAEAQRRQQETCARASIPASRERARLLRQASLEAMQLVGGARESLVDRALQETREQIAHLRADSRYPATLRALIEEALESLRPSLRESEKPQLVADLRDRPLLETILRELKLDCPVSYELSCQGGLAARSEDGRVVVINTLDARLQRATPYLRRYLAALFEAAQAESPSVPDGENLNLENVRL